MEIIISDERKIFSIQQEFNHIFPYLKLEFFSLPATLDPAASLKFVIRCSKTIGECRRTLNQQQIAVTPEMTVAELEQKLRKIFGIGVQVFRQSGKVWLETTFTDGWTLRQQNNEGEALSKAS